MPDTEIERSRELGSRIAGAAELQAIILRELSWTMPEVEVGPGLPISLRPEFDAQLAMVPALIYKIRTNVSGTVPDGTEIFHLSVTYQAVFSIPEGMQVTQEEAEAFGSATVVFIIFPYVREILQNTAGRAGMQILLQPLRVPFVPPDDSLQGAADESVEGVQNTEVVT